MPTRYRLVPESPHVDVDLALFRRTLPSSITLEEESGDIYATVNSAGPEDSHTQLLIDRELDLLFFLTHARLRAEMCQRIVTASMKVVFRVYDPLPPGIRPQIWSDQVTLQLRLWAIAENARDANLKALLFYQVIELSYPDPNDKTAYPPYVNSLREPHPRTEAKLLRNLVVHAGDATKKETSAYLQFLGLPPVLSNLVHPEWATKVTERTAIVERQAREVVLSVLTGAQPLQSLDAAR